MKISTSEGCRPHQPKPTKTSPRGSTILRLFNSSVQFRVLREGWGCDGCDPVGKFMEMASIRRLAPGDSRWIIARGSQGTVSMVLLMPARNIFDLAVSKPRCTWRIIPFSDHNWFVISCNHSFYTCSYPKWEPGNFHDQTAGCCCIARARSLGWSRTWIVPPCVWPRTPRMVLKCVGFLHWNDSASTVGSREECSLFTVARCSQCIDESCIF